MRVGAVGAKPYLTARQVEDYLAKRLDIKIDVQREVEVALNRLYYDGMIDIEYIAGLPMHGPGIGGNSNKRRMTFKF